MNYLKVHTEEINAGGWAGALLILLLFTSCTSTVSNSGDGETNAPDSNWLIPKGEIIKAQGRDGIPSLENPKFAGIEEVEDYLADDRYILGVKRGDEVRAYPHQILDWHEIVNDSFENINLAVTLCPLTGTGIVWERGGTQFGVSGLLFRNNLIPYDRSTNSHWSQMQMRSVEGVRAGENIGTVDVVETTWATWKKMYPDSRVLTTETGYDRNYEGFAYATAAGGNAGLYPVAHPDNRLEPNTRVHGLIAENSATEDATVRVYQIGKFGDEISVVHDTLDKEEIMIVGSERLDFTASFKTSVGDSVHLNFEAVQDSLPVVMKDQEGNRWNIFGNAVEGPRKGAQLTPTKSYTGYWFAWADFFPKPEIYKFN